MLEKYLNISLVKSDLKASNKEEVLRELSDFISKNHGGIAPEIIESALVEREHMDSTGIEHGVAIPHAKIEGLKELVIAVASSKKGINFNSHDNKPTHIFFVLLAPSGAISDHMKVLARLAKILLSTETVKKLYDAKTPDDLYNALISADKKI